eukprot:gnl/TRDRNA2_/TRDRNA2_157730_c0_seq4.p1 gnl/TRDRNA2_/TRDRNA2_157730_c0~~gnl/TRDRNA2_/TRDRNA2_157730_c0_seq4.p1  ORF type:complete len:111 (+),score=7.11 gnl/TRDRNA2_/TRDRNA2_157730_c0_seq4:89-421(+)
MAPISNFGEELVRISLIFRDASLTGIAKPKVELSLCMALLSSLGEEMGTFGLILSDTTHIAIASSVAAVSMHMAPLSSLGRTRQLLSHISRRSTPRLNGASVWPCSAALA